MQRRERAAPAQRRCRGWHFFRAGALGRFEEKKGKKEKKGEKRREKKRKGERKGKKSLFESISSVFQVYWSIFRLSPIYCYLQTRNAIAQNPNQDLPPRQSPPPNSKSRFADTLSLCITIAVAISYYAHNIAIHHGLRE